MRPQSGFNRSRASQMGNWEARLDSPSACRGQHTASSSDKEHRSDANNSRRRSEPDAMRRKVEQLQAVRFGKIARAGYGNEHGLLVTSMGSW